MRRLRLKPSRSNIAISPLNRKAEGHLPIRGVLGITLDHAAAQASDFLDGTPEGKLGDALSAIGLVGEEAGDAPVWQSLQAFLVSALVMDGGQLLGRTELAPADAGLAVEDQGRVGFVFADPLLLLGAELLGAELAAPGSIVVERHAPAAAPDSVVALHQSRKGRPCGLVERFNGETGHSSTAAFALAQCSAIGRRHDRAAIARADTARLTQAV